MNGEKDDGIGSGENPTAWQPPGGCDPAAELNLMEIKSKKDQQGNKSPKTSQVDFGSNCIVELIWHCYRMQTTRVQIPTPTLIYTTTSQNSLSEMSTSLFLEIFSCE